VNRPTGVGATAPGGPPGTDAGSPILAALAGAGAIGSTARQIAGRTARPLDAVRRGLEALSRDGRALRIGRGLWILRDFERLDGTPGFSDPESYVRRFESEFHLRMGRTPGPITFAPNDNLPVHRWWPYVQGYSAAFVQGVLSTSGLPRGATVLDPFAGSGTTLVESRRAGYAAVGTELLPISALAARVKVGFELAPEALAEAAVRTLERARSGPLAPLPFLRETVRQFDPPVLRALRHLRAALPDGGTPVHDAIRLAFGAILIPSSRLRRSPCLGYGPPRRGPSPNVPDAFRAQITAMVADLTALRAHRSAWGPPARVIEGDARSLPLQDGSVDLAITSPPYVNGMDYVMNYKLDLAWLGFARSYADLAALRHALVACDNLPRDSLTAYGEPAEAVDPWLPPILRSIVANVAQKGTYRRDDMHAVVARYFADLVPVLREVHRTLAPGGRFVLVVGDSLLAGTYVPGDLVLARLGAAQGFRVRSVAVARTRRSGQRRSFVLRESIVTLEKRSDGGRHRVRVRP